MESELSDQDRLSTLGSTHPIAYHVGQPEMDLDKWLIFSLLDKDFLVSLRMVCVFGTLGNEAIMVTKDEDVYGLGVNQSGCLGIGDLHSTLLPRKIEALSKKRIKKIACGSGPHLLACTYEGELYSWGHNGYCQLGNGSSSQCTVPTLITSNLTDKKVADVACGSHHSMCLTDDGEVFTWGQNNCGQVGLGTTANQPAPRRISITTGKKAVAIACGQTSSIALLESGELFAWGYNGNGQLGLGNNANQHLPCKVTNLQGVFISQVVCGYAHTLALSDEGVLYGWGANSYGQLGIGNKSNPSVPTRIAPEIGRVVEIGATHYNHLSSAMTQDAHVYMWGQCRGQCVMMPILTPFHSINSVFATFGTPCVTWTAISFDVQPVTRVLDALRSAFDEPEGSDVRFMVEGKVIHVHKAVLKIRCEHFRSMFATHWEGDTNEVEILQFSYNVYKAFLRYLYTDELDSNPEDAIGLLELANAYCESQLKLQCERIIKQGITVENAAMLYAAAIKYSAKELEDFCFRFALNHLSEVVQTEAFLHLDEPTVKSFILKAALSGAFRY
ncbi:unnamed protein product [Darwinula stevensoni]|uniref:BTB domain-containing protein n=1 Tax=Darwinula stevensoni TaxID=69355 RepID=A0A7R9FRA2_9CRUS|nr:unnamed protein product [Darwinula stevensoni]CAG0901286.1 unnamed protein product [Darwinula stevensoni]